LLDAFFQGFDKIMKEHEILQAVMRDMNAGWWEADMSRRVIRMSGFLQDLLRFPTPEIGFDEFKSHIPEPYMRYSGSETCLFHGDSTLERTLPLVLPDGRQLDKLRTYNVALSFAYLF